MHAQSKLIGLVGILLMGAAAVPTASRGELSPEIKSGLADSRFVYIATTRKDGTLGTRSESWFLYRQGAIYIVSTKKTWRFRRIKAGRTRAKLWVGAPNGPSFMATGAIVNEPEVHEILFQTYAKKYPDTEPTELMWPDREQEYRNGLKDGSRVLIKFTPTD